MADSDFYDLPIVTNPASISWGALIFNAESLAAPEPQNYQLGAIRDAILDYNQSLADIGSLTPDANAMIIGDGVNWGSFVADGDVVNFMTTPTADNLRTAVTGTTGTGSLVFGTSPTFTTSIIDPLVIGGTGTTSTLKLRSTSGVGATGADIIFQVGNNGATEAMRILNSGNVGIGTTSPQRKLHVHEASSNPVYLQLTNTDTGSTSTDGVQLIISSTGAYLTNRENSPLIFQTNDTDRMRITGTGNVGIGLTGPTNKLGVAGAVAIGAGYAGTYTAPTNGLIVQGIGGFGTAAPNANTGLQVSKDISSSTGYGQIEAVGATTTTKRLSLGFDTTNNVGFIQSSITGTGYVNLLLCPGGASVGIGVTPSATWLAIKAGTTAAAQINLASSTAPTSPNNGDIWFDGSDLKLRAGGSTYTLTKS